MSACTCGHTQLAHIPPEQMGWPDDREDECQPMFCQCPQFVVDRPSLAFEPVPGSDKVRCPVCWAVGFSSGRWQDACRAGHPHQCPTCVRAFPSRQGLGVHARHCKASA